MLLRPVSRTSHGSKLGRLDLRQRRTMSGASTGASRDSRSPWPPATSSSQDHPAASAPAALPPRPSQAGGGSALSWGSGPLHGHHQGPAERSRPGMGSPAGPSQVQPPSAQHAPPAAPQQPQATRTASPVRPEGTATGDHKRDDGDAQKGRADHVQRWRSESAAKSEHPKLPASSSAAPPRDASQPLFSCEALASATFAPPLLKVRNHLPPLKAPGESRPSALVYDPAVGTAQLLGDGDLHQRTGSSIDVFVPAAWLGAGTWRCGAPSSGPGELCRTKPRVGEDYDAFDAKPVRERKLWGTDVYTDDSDVLCICLHTGWLRPADDSDIATAGSTATTTNGFQVTLAVLPPLIRYQGSARGGLRSRSWGNSHDGYSLSIQRVAPTDVSCVLGLVWEPC